MRRKHHQVRCHPGSGRRIEASDGQNCFHQVEGAKSRKSVFCKKSLLFRQYAAFRLHRTYSGLKLQPSGDFSQRAPAISYITKAMV
jgi:hypothetical protein